LRSKASFWGAFLRSNRGLEDGCRAVEHSRLPASPVDTIPWGLAPRSQLSKYWNIYIYIYIYYFFREPSDGLLPAPYYDNDKTQRMPHTHIYIYIMEIDELSKSIGKIDGIFLHTTEPQGASTLMAARYQERRQQ
jgi:hypothetical protein